MLSEGKTNDSKQERPTAKEQTVAKNISTTNGGALHKLRDFFGVLWASPAPICDQEVDDTFTKESEAPNFDRATSSTDVDKWNSFLKRVISDTEMNPVTISDEDQTSHKSSIAPISYISESSEHVMAGDPTQIRALQREIEALRTENATLRKKATEMQAESIRRARLIAMQRARLAELKQNAEFSSIKIRSRDQSHLSTLSKEHEQDAFPKCRILASNANEEMDHSDKESPNAWGFCTTTLADDVTDPAIGRSELRENQEDIQAFVTKEQRFRQNAEAAETLYREQAEKLTKIQQDISDSERLHATLQNDIERTHESYQALDRDMRDMEAARDKFTIELEHLETRQGVLQDTLSQLEAKHQSLENKVKRAAERKNELEEAIHKKVTELAKLKRELQSEGTAYEELHTQKEKLARILQNDQQNQKNLEEEVSVLKRELERLQASHRTVTLTHADLQRSMSNLEADKLHMESEVEKLSATWLTASKSMDMIYEERLKQMAHLVEKEKDVITRLKASTETSHQLQEKAKELEAVRDLIAVDIHNLQERRKDLTQTVENLERKLEHLNSEAESSEKRRVNIVKNMEREAANLMERLTRLREEVAEATESLELSRKRISGSNVSKETSRRLMARTLSIDCQIESNIPEHVEISNIADTIASHDKEEAMQSERNPKSMGNYCDIRLLQSEPKSLKAIGPWKPSQRQGRRDSNSRGSLSTVYSTNKQELTCGFSCPDESLVSVESIAVPLDLGSERKRIWQEHQAWVANLEEKRLRQELEFRNEERMWLETLAEYETRLRETHSTKSQIRKHSVSVGVGATASPVGPRFTDPKIRRERDLHGFVNSDAPWRSRVAIAAANNAQCSFGMICSPVSHPSAIQTEDIRPRYTVIRK